MLSFNNDLYGIECKPNITRMGKKVCGLCIQKPVYTYDICICMFVIPTDFSAVIQCLRFGQNECRQNEQRASSISCILSTLTKKWNNIQAMTATKKSSSSASIATSFITRLPSTTPGATINVNSNPNAKKTSHQHR